MSNKAIHIWSYLDEYHKEKKYIWEAIDRVFESGKLILGDEVKLFEEEFAKRCDTKYGIGVGNGTDALFLALKALDIKAGDEVITVANTAIPTAAAIAATGAIPVFVDIEQETYLIDPTKIEEKITKRTKCILPVHLYGQCANMDAISTIATKHNLFVVEDCAQSQGAKWNGKTAGSMSDIAAFSFYPTKVLGAYGDGGMILTNSKELSEKIRMLRMYGIKENYYSEFLGYNSRLDELHAAILRYKLTNIDQYLDKRNKIAKRYDKALADTPLILPVMQENTYHAYYLYVCRHPQRDEIIKFLESKNIYINISYKYPLHLMRGFQYLGYKSGELPMTEKGAAEIFSIPIYPELTEEDQDRVIQALHDFFKQ